MTHPASATKPIFASRLALFYAAYFVLTGIQLPYLPLWLELKGLDAREIGIVLAIPTLIRIISVPAIARLSDRYGDARRILILLSFAGALGYCGLGFASAALTIAAIVVLMSIPNTPIMTIADAYALQRLDARSYGPVRLWGSVAFVVANIGVGYAIDRIAPENIVWLLAAAAVALALMSLLLVPHEASRTAPHAAVRAGMLLRKPAFLAIVAAAALIQASHAFYYAFSTVQWKAAGFEGSAIGFLWATGVVAEILLFALAGRLPPAIGPAALLTMGAAGAVIRWTAMAFDPQGWILLPLQALHGLSFGATHLGTVAYVARSAPPGLAATAQGIFSTLFGLVLAVLLGVSGQLYTAFGAGGYAMMAICAAIGGLVILAMRQKISAAG
jgi:PPP family 3-phenylpropionic acid transporter